MVFEVWYYSCICPKLLRTKNVIAVDDLFVEERNIVGPEHVVLRLRAAAQMMEGLPDGDRN
jgi:hypothetical protein